MRLKKPENANYCATIVKLKNIIKLENCDNVVATTIFGFQAIVGKDSKEGDIGIVFPVETQLSEKFCSENNLFRHAEKNKDNTKKGYIEENRRIRAVKFRGNVSNCLFLPLSSLEYVIGKYPEVDLVDGDEFDELYGEGICKKYIVKVPKSGMTNKQGQPKRFNRVDTKFIPEHFSTDNYFKNSDKVSMDERVVVTQKLHGTSIRVANTIVKRKKTIRDHIASFLGVKVQEHEFDMVFGSRKVIKDINNPYQNHYYHAEKGDADLWTREGKKFEGLIPENFVVYAEIVGWAAPETPIQNGYTYNLPKGTCEVYIYRVGIVNEKGLVTDLTWEQIKEFCQQRSLKYVPEIFVGKHVGFKVEDYLDSILSETYDQCIKLDPDTVDEGVCIRVDKLTPYILKAKSPKFFEYETAQLDSGKEDLESIDN